MGLNDELAKEFKTTPQVIANIRSQHFQGKNKVEIFKIFAVKISRDIKHKSFRYADREATMVFLKTLTDEEFEKITIPPVDKWKFQGVGTILKDMVGNDYMLTNQPPTLEEFLAFHKEWRAKRITLGKNPVHENNRVKQYESEPEEIQKRLSESFVKLTQTTP